MKQGAVMNSLKVRLQIITFSLSLFIGFTMQTICIYIISKNTSNIVYLIEQWNYGSDLFNFVYPLFSTLPFCFTMYFEKKNGFLKCVHNRINTKKYLRYEYFRQIAFGGICVALISFLSLLMSLYIIKPPLIDYRNKSNLGEELLGQLQISIPLVYGTILSLWRGFIAALYTTTGFILSLYISNLFVILTTPFIYSIIENFVFSILGIPEFSICSSFYPNRLQPGVINGFTVLIGPFILIVINLILYLLLKKRDNKNV